MNGLKAAIVFFVSLLNVITQSETQILFLAPKPHILGPQHADILHAYFCNAKGAPVQFLLVRWQQVEIKNWRGFHLFKCLGRHGRLLSLVRENQFKIR